MVRLTSISEKSTRELPVRFHCLNSLHSRRDDVASIRFEDASETVWIETLKAGAIEIHLSVIESQAPSRLVLATSSPGSFEGTYTAIFESNDGGTHGSFTETSTATGFVPKLIRFLLVIQADIIDRYTRDAQAEITRRGKV